MHDDGGPGATAPLVAITGRRRSAGGAHDGPVALDRLEVEVYFTGYADRLAAAGGVPVHLPARVDPAAAMSRVEALVLTGGTDVDPARYGQGHRETTPVLDPVRDAFEVELLDAALARGMPVLAICRGLQLLNVSRGGTLHAHLADHPVGGDGTHEVHFTPGCRLAGLYGPVARINSMHHQSVAKLGAGLVVAGRAPDGVVEAVELPGSEVIGVQWHPEQLARTEPVFEWVVGAAAAYGAVRRGGGCDTTGSEMIP